MGDATGDVVEIGNMAYDIGRENRIRRAMILPNRTRCIRPEKGDLRLHAMAFRLGCHIVGRFNTEVPHALI